MISIIAAVSRNGVIGRGNDLPWSLPSDLKHFQRSTRDQTVIMGRNTWDSLPAAFRPLPRRKNIIVSKTMMNIDEAIVCRSLSDAVIVAEDNGWIIGGAQLYKTAFDIGVVDQIVLSEIDADVEGDVYFPEFDRAVHPEVERIPVRGDILPYDIVTYRWVSLQN